MRILLSSMLALAVFGVSQSQGTIIVSADPDYNLNAPVFTLDPEAFGPAARNIAADRELRQAFQVSRTFDVTDIVLSLIVQDTGGGLDVEFFEVADVNAETWAPLGPAIQTINLTSNDMVASTVRLGISLTGADQFTLAQRDTGTEGYGIQLSNNDDTTNIGAWRHSNDGTDNFPGGLYYSEGGTSPNPARDMGVNIIPEPSVAILLLTGLGVLGVLRRRQ